MKMSVNRNRFVRKPIVIVVVLAALVLVVVSPLAVRAISTIPGMRWQNLSNVGQTYGAISALVAALALVGVAVSIFIQARETRHGRVVAARTRHYELTRMAMENPLYMRAYSTSTSSEDDDRLMAYINLLLEFWRMMWEFDDFPANHLGEVTAPNLFATAAGRDYWHRFGEALSGSYSDTKKNREFYCILNNAFTAAAVSGSQRAVSPERADPVGSLPVWLPTAVESDTASMLNLGVQLVDSDPGQARRWFEKAAEAGNADAMNNLGVLLKDSDPGQARGWYEKAAEAGNADAMNNLGVLLYDGDPGQARRWFEKAARAGNAGAMSDLGLLLKDSDPRQARRWFEKAAEAGNAGAMNNLGVLLYDGDPGQARRWFEKAAEARAARS
jgi:TPR repeat protein